LFRSLQSSTPRAGRAGVVALLDAQNRERKQQGELARRSKQALSGSRWMLSMNRICSSQDVGGIWLIIPVWRLRKPIYRAIDQDYWITN
jgi:hypothetical protein